MAKKKAKTSSKKNRLGSPSEWSYAKWAAFLVLLGTAVYLLFGYLPAERARDAERKEFAENKAQIEDIATKITTQYPPSEEKHESYCAYTSVKFEKGERYCGVSVELVYKNVSIDKANEIARDSSIKTGYTLHPEQGKENRQDKFVEPDYPYELSRNLNERQSLSTGFNSISKDCGMSFYYDTGTQSYRELQVFITCQRDSKAEYFPPKKY